MHDELTQLGSQFGQHQTQSLVVPPDEPEPFSEATVQESDSGTVQGLRALSEAMLEGPDAVEIDEEDEEDEDMDDEEDKDEGETEDRPLALLVKPKPKKGDPQKDVSTTEKG